MNDFVNAAWPVFAVILLAAALLAFWRVMLTRSCWRCRTPLRPKQKKRPGLKNLVPLTRCDRCGVWRGRLIR